MPLSATARPPAVKRVLCTHCAQPTDVAKRAMSVFCPHCKKRLILEDFKIRSYYAVREFSTCGDIVVERKGHVVASIKVDHLIVKGKVEGHVTARGNVHVHKTGCLRGDLEAPSIRVDQGGVLDGFLRIDRGDAPLHAR